MIHPPSGRPPGLLAGMTVLVADDFGPLRQLIALQLERLGSARVLEAEHGEQALALLEQGAVQLVVSDWDMPRMGGGRVPARGVGPQPGAG